jgi:hypothetical protein
MKIHSRRYLAPCRLTSIRCDCGHMATFHQSNKDNSNKSNYFFGCPNWRNEHKCTFFAWAAEYLIIRDIETLNGLNSEGEHQLKHPIDKAVQEKLNCPICFSNERSHLVTPCNHLCCCSTCATQIKDECPICRHPINSIQRIFFV